MRRVVADTNVLTSALMFGGLPGTFLDMALLPALFKVSAEDALAIRAKLTGVAAIVEPTAVLDAVVDDPDDNRVIECAVEGQAGCIVRGDRHLLMLDSYESLPIMTVRQFVDHTQAEATLSDLSAHRDQYGAFPASSLLWGPLRCECWPE